MTRASPKAITTIGGVLAAVGALAGLVAVLLGIGGDVAVVRADVARHEVALTTQAQTLRAVEIATVVVPGRLDEIVRRLDDLTRRLEAMQGVK